MKDAPDGDNFALSKRWLMWYTSDYFLLMLSHLLWPLPRKDKYVI